MGTHPIPMERSTTTLSIQSVVLDRRAHGRGDFERQRVGVNGVLFEGEQTGRHVFGHGGIRRTPVSHDLAEERPHRSLFHGRQYRRQRGLLDARAAEQSIRHQRMQSMLVQSAEHRSELRDELPVHGSSVSPRPTPAAFRLVDTDCRQQVMKVRPSGRILLFDWISQNQRAD